jgi:hypothetical protein
VACSRLPGPNRPFPQRAPSPPGVAFLSPSARSLSESGGRGGMLPGLFSTVSDFRRFLTQGRFPSTTWFRWLAWGQSGRFPASRPLGAIVHARFSAAERPRGRAVEASGGHAPAGIRRADPLHARPKRKARKGRSYSLRIMGKALHHLLARVRSVLVEVGDFPRGDAQAPLDRHGLPAIPVAKGVVAG